MFNEILSRPRIKLLNNLGMMILEPIKLKITTQPQQIQYESIDDLEINTF